MKKVWIYASNVFLNVTNGSYVLAMKISTYHDSELLAKSIGNPAIVTIYAYYHPIHLVFKARYDEWVAQGGLQKGQTLNLNQLLKLLRTSKIDTFEAMVLMVYEKTSPQFVSLFPQGRKPFQSGKQTDRISAVQALIIAIGDDAALADAKVAIETFYTLLDNANTKQKGSKGSMKDKKDELEIARVNMCIAQYSDLADLMKMYAASPILMEKFFDLASIRNHKQNIYTSHLGAGKQENLLVHTFTSGDTFKVESDQNLRIFLSDNPDTLTGDKVVIMANVPAEVNVNSFNVNLETNRYLVVVNLGDNEAAYKVAL